MDCDLFFSALELERDKCPKLAKKISLFIGHLLNQVFILNRIVQV